MIVTAILGSPRKKGATSTIAQSFVEEAESRGAEVKNYFLHGMDYKGCQGCHACKSKTEDCVMKDDLTATLEDIKTSDIVVFASPVHYWDVSGQFKSFFDRTWSFVKPDYKTNPEPSRVQKGKKAVLVLSQADMEDVHKDVYEKYSFFLSMYGFEVYLIRAVEMQNDASRITEAIKPYTTKAREIAAQMIPKDKEWAERFDS